ncbi:MAG: hypothetical protein JWM43_2758 [Acidobacteriaceae bacterium]|nr:hypothetical protein [Acidobacteriaceae bacterium]
MGMMMTKVSVWRVGLVGLGLMGCGVGFAADNVIDPAKMAKVATVDERFQSFNVEMLEVTGGRFWAPYGAKASAAPASPEAANASVPAGMDPSLYRYRQPINLSDPRLRKLAAALGPSYIRVSGTWANSTYFQDNEEPAMKTPPEGFGGVLTRRQWKGVVDFSKAVDARIVTSFAITPGVRDGDGIWTPVEAKKFLAYTRQAGGSIAAAEMFNEPTFAVMGGAPKTYDGAAYGKDFKVFRSYIKQAAPDMLILGPGSVGEAGSLGDVGTMKITRSEDMLTASGPGVDAFSYHFYGGVSQRCKALGAAAQTTAEAALSDQWLARTNRDEAFYARLRDRFEPGKPLWLTETGETACGGNPWAATFVDSFRYLNQLGTLAQRGVKVVMHNTLAASDYALIDEATLTPRPNYWAAVLWRRMMGTTVLNPGPSEPAENLHVYAQCLRGVPGGVSMLVINANRGVARKLDVEGKSERYTLTSQELMGSRVELNGKELSMEENDTLPKFAGKGVRSGEVTFAPESITFLAIAGARNPACR